MSTIASRRKKRAANPPAWHLVTNHMNVLYMMAAGMVTEPAGFKKYYYDSLQVNPGSIPLFRDVFPLHALEQAVSERSHLRPCVLSFDLSEVTGSIQILNKDGKTRAAGFPVKRWTSKGLCVFAPAPLPLYLVTRVNFRSEEDRKKFIMAAGDVANVDVQSFDVRVDEELFGRVTGDFWAPGQTINSKVPASHTKMSGVPQESWLPPKELELEGYSDAESSTCISAQSLGGSLAMIYHCANSSQVGLEVFRLVTQSDDSAELGEIEDPVLAQLPVWLRMGNLSAEVDLRARLFWGAVGALDQALQEGNPDDPVDVVLRFFDQQLTEITDDPYRARLERLTADMRNVMGLSGATVSQLFENHRGSLSRPFLLFCLHRTCVELLEFSHPLLSHEERLLSAVLFGVRDGWLKLPREMRNPALSDYVMYRMAERELAQRNVALSLPLVEPPIPLRRLFGSASEAWSNAESRAAEELANEMAWRDCIQTTIASIDGSSLQEPSQEMGKYVFEGEIAVTRKINQERFLQHLGMWPPPDNDLQDRVREALSVSSIKGSTLQ